MKKIFIGFSILLSLIILSSNVVFATEEPVIIEENVESSSVESTLDIKGNAEVSADINNGEFNRNNMPMYGNENDSEMSVDGNVNGENGFPFGGEMPEGFDPSQGFPEGQMPPDMPQMQGQFPGGGRGQMGGQGGQFPGMQGQETAEPIEDVSVSFFEEYFTPICSVVLLIFAFIFVKFYKRKSY